MRGEMELEESRMLRRGGKKEWRQEGRKNRRGKYVLAVKERGRTK